MLSMVVALRVVARYAMELPSGDQAGEKATPTAFDNLRSAPVCGSIRVNIVWKFASGSGSAVGEKSDFSARDQEIECAS